MDEKATFRPALTSDRARFACTRCKRQKLKCDNQRPCYLCVRSRMECKDDERRVTKSRARASVRENERNRPSSEVVRPEAAASYSVISAPMTPRHPNDVQLCVERTSTLRVVQQIYEEYQGGTTVGKELDAIPDSPAVNSCGPDVGEVSMPIADLIGVVLPPPPVIECLLDTFSESVLWYLALFHEPTLRERFRRIYDADRAYPEDTPFLMLVLIILATGARYVTPRQKDRYAVEFNTSLLQDNLINAIERKLLDILDENTTTSVAFLVLLGAHYLFNQKTRRAFNIMGATVRAAQSMELHNESSWGAVSDTEREVRRRLWWTLYTGDKFISQVFGRPAVIHDMDINVKYPNLSDEVTISCPTQSDTGTTRRTQLPIASGSYHRFKAMLYEIASPITRGMSSPKGRAIQDIAEQINTVQQQLLEWEKSLPVELQLESYESTPFNPENRTVSATLHLQALALQVTYDNIQLLLHRPLIACKDLSRYPCGTEDAANGRGEPPTGAKEGSETIVSTSRRQSWASALRMSFLVKHQEALEFLKNTPLGAHIGLHCFTAGVMLAVFALSRPFSGQAQEAKQGIGRLIRIPTSGQSWSAAFNQGADVLKDMLKLIMDKELKALVGPSDQNQQNHISYRNDATKKKDSHAQRHYMGSDGHTIQGTMQSTTAMRGSPTSGALGHQQQPDSHLTSTNLFDLGDCSGSVSTDDFGEALSSMENVLLGSAVLDLEYVDWSRQQLFAPWGPT